MTFDIIRGDALALPLANNTVDLVVTSPPYFGLRSYQDDGEHYAGQIGSERLPSEYLDELIAATAEMKRVLKSTGSIWVNMGDKYVADNRGSGRDVKRGDAKYAPPGHLGYVFEGGMRQKSLMGMPWRYAIRCMDELRLILRAEVIWSKPNGLPESVTDRVRRSHEQWFHFTVRPRYYSAVDEIREPQTGGSNRGRSDGKPPPGGKIERAIAAGEHGGNYGGTNPDIFDPRGKLPGSVWTIPTQPLTVPPELGVDHFAAFPMEWPRRIIRGWSPPGVCTGCGEGRRPVVAKTLRHKQFVTPDHRARMRPGVALGMSGRTDYYDELGSTEATITGYVCACGETGYEGDDDFRWVGQDFSPAHTTPAVVLDPFGGTGTTALVAHALGRHGISVDMSADYCRLATWRCNDRAQLAAAMQVDKPEPVAEDQLDLFGAGA